VAVPRTPDGATARTHRLSVRLNDAEHDALTAARGSNDPSDFIRELIHAAAALRAARQTRNEDR
jgi:hypothetical protein